MTQKLNGSKIFIYFTLMMVEMSDVYDKNNAVINTLYITSTCGGVNLMGRIETRKLLLLSISCCLF